MMFAVSKFFIWCLQPLAQSGWNEARSRGAVWGLHRRPGAGPVGGSTGPGLSLPGGDPAQSLWQEAPSGGGGHPGPRSHPKSRSQNSPRYVLALIQCSGFNLMFIWLFDWGDFWKVQFVITFSIASLKLFLFIAPYVKVYLIDGKHCVEKQKTTVARRTLDPLYQQQLAFTEDYRGKILQVCIQYI